MMKKAPLKPPPDVVFVVVDRSGTFSHCAHETRQKARDDARRANQSWGTADMHPFKVVDYVCKKREK
jgi:hypothetical protein